jgi:hypothetical protein
VIRIQGFEMAALLAPVFGIMAFAAGQGLTGILRNFSVEFLAQKIE